MFGFQAKQELIAIILTLFLCGVKYFFNRQEEAIAYLHRAYLEWVYRDPE